MLKQIEKHISDVENFHADSSERAEIFRIKYFGKKGILNDLFLAFKKVPNEEKKAFGVTFNNDGTKMFMVGETSGNDGVADDVHEYVLSTPYDISTATFSTGIEVFSDVGSRTLRQIQFNKDGSKMFVSARHTNQNPNMNRIYQYSLSTNFDLSTATYSGISFQANTANVGITKSLYGFAFNNDGTMMFPVSYTHLTLPTRLMV